jgi:Ca2+-transporting ATPase
MAAKVLTKSFAAVEKLGAINIVLIDETAILNTAPADETDASSPKRYNRAWNAMDVVRKAHIGVSIITDGPAAAAKSVALRIGFAKTPAELEIIPGKQLRRMHDGEVLKLIRGHGAIFARLTPEDKLRIISLARHGGKVTGSKTGDIPAMQRANLGIAMGPSANDTVRRSADIVLLDGNFTTLVGAIQDGRIILRSVQKGILSAVAAHIAGLTVVLCGLAAAVAFHAPLGLAIVQLFALNLLAGLFPLAALSRDKTDGEPMNGAPHTAAHGILSRQSIPGLLESGLLMGGLAFANYLWFFERQGIDAANLASGSHIHMQAASLTYLTLAMTQVINILQYRTDKGLFSRYQLHNRRLWLALALFLFLVANTIHNPLIAPQFMAAALDPQDWLYAFGAAGIFLVIREFQRHNRKHHRKAVIELHRRVNVATRT